jgi:lipopolysaccharide export system permease protein
VSLRIPQLISRFLPFAVLLGTLITLATLNQNSEVVSMKAAGISAHQIIAPLIVASLAVAAVSFVFNERVVTRATADARAWEKVDYGPVPKDTGVPQRLGALRRRPRPRPPGEGRGARAPAAGVTIYDRNWETLQGIVNAKRARAPAASGCWRRWTRSTSISAGCVKSATAPYGRGSIPTQFTLAKSIRTSRTSRPCARRSSSSSASGRDTAELEAGLWHKFSGPLSAVLMPLLAAVAAFGLARSGQLFLRAVIGMALGFAYFVADNFAIAMGNLGAYPPLLAAWAPFALFLLIGETVLSGPRSDRNSRPTGRQPPRRGGAPASPASPARAR